MDSANSGWPGSTPARVAGTAAGPVVEAAAGIGSARRSKNGSSFGHSMLEEGGGLIGGQAAGLFLEEGLVGWRADPGRRVGALSGSRRV